MLFPGNEVVVDTETVIISTPDLVDIVKMRNVEVGMENIISQHLDKLQEPATKGGGDANCEECS